MSGLCDLTTASTQGISSPVPSIKSMLGFTLLYIKRDLAKFFLISSSSMPVPANEYLKRTTSDASSLHKTKHFAPCSAKPPSEAIIEAWKLVFPVLGRAPTITK